MSGLLVKAKIHKIYFALSEREARANAKAFINEYKDVFPRLVAVSYTHLTLPTN